MEAMWAAAGLPRLKGLAEVGRPRTAGLPRRGKAPARRTDAKREAGSRAQVASGGRRRDARRPGTVAQIGAWTRYRAGRRCDHSTGKVRAGRGRDARGGRGIAVELGAAGATVYVTGRTTASQASEYDRPETIEETAELVTEVGGEGIAIRVDHLVPAEVEALVARIRAERGRLDILVNDIWGGEQLFEWNKPVWEHNLENGLRLLRLAVDTHLITAHYALPLHDREAGRPPGRGDRRHGGVQCRPLPPVGVLRSRQDGGDPHGLGARQGSRAAWRDGGAITPGWMRSEMMLDNYGVTEANWRDATASVAAFRDLGNAALRRPRGRRARRRSRRARWNGQSLSSGGLAQVYGFTDLDGSRPDCWRYIVEVQEAGKPRHDGLSLSRQILTRAGSVARPAQSPNDNAYKSSLAAGAA